MSFRARDRHTHMTITEIDETAFAAHRRELHVHCYRMLGSFDDAEETVQETFLRAWRARDTFAGRASLRAWLYRIATNACLDLLERRPRQVSADGEVAWLQPYPDELLDAIPSDEAGPDAQVVARETIELTFLVAVQHLPPRSRAVLITRDVLGWRAKEVAELLGITVAAVNSHLQRARGAVAEHLPAQRVEWPAAEDASAAERALVQTYIDASERGDAEAVAATLTGDVRFSMPPVPGVWVGREDVVGSWTKGGFGSADWGELRCVLTRANRQTAVAGYLRRPGATAFTALALDVLRFADGRIAEIVTFGEDRFAAFGLPATL
jgi:RNA polymerase sigma-70 factor (TIGR02960 family)